VNTIERPGYLRIHGENSFFSQINPAIMATSATSFNYEFQTKVEFHPDHYSETAGMGLYYDSNNWIYAHLTHSESFGGTVLSLLQAKLGERIEFVHNNITVPKGVVELKIVYNSGIANIFYRLSDNMDWQVFVDNIDVLYLSDEGVNGEPGEIGGFTGLFNFIGSVDSHQHDSFADFDYYSVKNY
jgi:xylan 1,4-beta-xylosidase